MPLPAPSRPPQGRPSRTRQTATREQFLDAAVNLFARQGVAATTLAHIAREVGVTSAMVHYHFANREQLLDAVSNERIMPFLNAMWDLMTPEGMGDPVRVLHETADCIFDHAQRLPWLAPIWLSDMGSSSGELSQRAMQHVPVVKVQQLTMAIEQAQARGEIASTLQPHMIFMTMVGMVLVPFATLSNCRTVHPDADFSVDILRRHVAGAVNNLLRPQ